VSVCVCVSERECVYMKRPTITELVVSAHSNELCVCWRVCVYVCVHAYVCVCIGVCS